MMKPLEGIKVVEIGTYVAVPSTARVLGDWGADVIKIEMLTGLAESNADVNCDGNVDSDDLTVHARYVAKIISEWPKNGAETN